MPLHQFTDCRLTLSRHAWLWAGLGPIAFGLLLTGCILAAAADPPPTKKDTPAKKESAEEIEKEVQKALESLRKGVPAAPRKEVDDRPVQGEKRKPVPEDGKPAAPGEKGKPVPQNGKPAAGEKRVPDSIQGVLKAQNSEKSTITLTLPSKGQPAEDRTFDVANDAKILIGDGKPAKLADLPPGSQIVLVLSKEQKVIGIAASGPSVAGTIKAVDPAKNTVTVTYFTVKGGPAEERTLEVAQDAKITIDKSRASKLSDLTTGVRVTLVLGLDQKSVAAVHASTPQPELTTISGVLSQLDAVKGTVTVSVAGRKGQPPEPQSFTVPKEAKVLVDLDKSAKLLDLKPGATVAVEMTADRKVVALRASGPSLAGVLKAANAENGKITVTVNATKSAPGEDKEFTIAKDAKFWMGKRPVELGQLQAGARVTMSLSIDEKTVIGARFEK